MSHNYRGCFSNVKHFPLKIDNAVEVDGNMIMMMLIPSKEVINVVVSAEEESVVSTEYDINSPEEVANAFLDYAAYVKAAFLAKAERELEEREQAND